MDMHQLSARLRQIENNRLYEGLTLTEANSVKLWENAGRLIKEAALTPDQIQQLFTSVEQGATASGGNRTMLGKGKDAMGAVKKAYDDLVAQVQNSGPVKGVDAMYDQAAEKLKQATGGDEGVMKYVQKYRDFAKAHPIAQSLIYSALIAAAGISGVGAGGAAALGLFKMVDKLLQGEKFSTAVGKGLATGATAYAAGQIGQAMRGQPAPTGAPTPPAADAASGTFSGALSQATDAGTKAGLDAVANGSVTDYSSAKDFAMNYWDQMVQAGIPGADSAREKILTQMMGALKDAGKMESVSLSENQIATLFTLVQLKNRQFNEGIWDSIKDKAATFGKNLTTKVTADKLNSAWKKAGSPTDSEAVAQVIQGTGVDPSVVSKAYTDMGIEAPKGKIEPTLNKTADTEPAAVNIKDILAQILALDPKDQQQVLAHLKK